MSSGGKGSSRSATRSTASTSNTSTVVNDTDNRVYDVGDSANIVDGNNNYVINTDHNAIGSAMDLARLSVNAGNDIARGGLELSARTNDTIAAFAGDVLAGNADLARTAVDGIGDAYQLANDSTSNLIDKTLGFIGDLASKFTAQTGSTVTALNDIAKEQNKSTDQRVAEISSNAIKYTAIALVVGVGLLALATYARKS